MKVRAIDGVRVPMENQPHSYIEAETVEVEASLYYQRRLADGDLVLVDEQAVGAERKNAKVGGHDGTN